MNNTSWASIWLFLIYFTMLLDGCVQNQYNREFLKKLREIKQELRK